MDEINQLKAKIQKLETEVLTVREQLENENNEKNIREKVSRISVVVGMFLGTLGFGLLLWFFKLDLNTLSAWSTVYSGIRNFFLFC